MDPPWRFVTSQPAGPTRAGVHPGAGAGAHDRICDLAHPAMRAAMAGVEPRLEAMIDAGLARVAGSIAEAGLAEAAMLPRAAVVLLAPMRPRRIFGIAHNYHCALAERGVPAPADPVLFMKDGATVIGPGEAIVLPPGVGGCTYEVELAAVIGSMATDVPVADALSHVVAYGIFNDISASEIIRRDGSFERGKNLPTFGPFGPFLATVDEVADPQRLDLELLVDDAVRQRSSTAQMLFGVAELVSRISRSTTLRPGDVIATGTPAGVAPVQKPPTWLRPGDRLRATVMGLGCLENPVVEGVVAHE